jgi:hypothetical protein
VAEAASAWLETLIETGRTAAPDASFLAPDGVLTVRADLRGIDLIRIELPPGPQLHLQSLGVTAPTEPDVAALATLTASSWFADYEAAFDLRRLLDFDAPSGTMVHTKADEPSWIELRFARPVDVTRLDLRNVAKPTASRAAGLRISVSGPGGPLAVIYDAATRERDVAHLLATAVGHDRRVSTPAAPALAVVIATTLFGHYDQARKAFDALIDLSDEERRHYRRAISGTVLADRKLEWTIHGPQRCFRFWTEAEKVRYLTDTVAVCDALRSLTPNTCFGFGAALATVRDGEPIPHDDDLDIIVGFDPHEASTLPEALARIETHLRGLGFRVAGNFTAHRHVSREGRKHVDVFVGLFEGDVVSWYPGPRGVLDRATMYPTSEGSLLGVTVPLPRNPLVYLERTYGPDWRHPDPAFKHAWDRSAYSDLVKRPARA